MSLAPSILIANCNVIGYTMIRDFRHKGLKRFFETGSKAGIQAAHAAHLRLILGWLDAATRPFDGSDACEVDYEDYH